jgi:hypothetical protein
VIAPAILVAALALFEAGDRDRRPEPVGFGHDP